MKVIQTLAFAFLFLVSIFTGTDAFANPTSVNLKFTYAHTGVLRVDAKFDEPTTTRCIARHRSSLYYEGDELGDAGVIRRSTLSRSIRVGRTSTSLRAFDLKGAKKKNGKDPIMAVQMRLVCGDETISSNIVARYIICGDTVKRVSLQQYYEDLTAKLAFSK